MANIVIKKKIELGFLGEDNKEDYLVFKSIPVKKYKDLMNNRPEEDDGQVDFILEILKDNFIEGSFGGEKVEKTDVEDLDVEVTIMCFKKLTGQEPDPKV